MMNKTTNRTGERRNNKWNKKGGREMMKGDVEEK